VAPRLRKIERSTLSGAGVGAPAESKHVLSEAKGGVERSSQQGRTLRLRAANYCGPPLREASPWDRVLGMPFSEQMCMPRAAPRRMKTGTPTTRIPRTTRTGLDFIRVVCVVRVLFSEQPVMS